MSETGLGARTAARLGWQVLGVCLGLGALLPWTPACGPKTPPKPMPAPSRAVAEPPREQLVVNFDKLFRPEAKMDVVQTPGVSEEVCRVLIAEAHQQATGAGTEPEHIRVLRREVMRAGRTVVAGEVAARMTSEVVGTAAKDSALERYRTLNQPEKLILLGEKTNADALLVLEESGRWGANMIASVLSDGAVSMRPASGEADRGSGCGAGEVSLPVTQYYVGIRAKLVSLQRADKAILADIEAFVPAAQPIGEVKFNKFTYTPRHEPTCLDYQLNGFTNQWECLMSPEVVAWDRTETWCPALAERMGQEDSKIRTMNDTAEYQRVVQDAVKLLWQKLPDRARCRSEQRPAPAEEAPAEEEASKKGKRR